MKLRRVWCGQSGQKFRFEVNFLDRNVPNAGGVYIFVRRRALLWLTPLYIGTAEVLCQQLLTHELWPQAWWMHGATERHFLILESEEKRTRTKQDLLRRFKPVMNRKSGLS